MCNNFMVGTCPSVVMYVTNTNKCAYVLHTYVCVSVYILLTNNDQYTHGIEASSPRVPCLSMSLYVQ